MKIRVAFIGCLLLMVSHRSTAETPVLPVPQYVKESPKTILFSPQLVLEGKGIDKSITARLNHHWKNFWTDAAPAKKIANPIRVQLVLLGQDQQAGQLVHSLAPHWQDSIGKQGYILVFNAGNRMIAAHTETGLFYGLQSLRQLTRSHYNKELLIADWPSFEHRTIYDDISRGPISTVPYIKKQIERLAELKINYLSFYIEHVIQPLSYPDFAPPDGKLTITQIKELSAYAAEYHMQLIGSFQSFGHFEKILALPRYKPMGATSTLISPQSPEARAFLDSVIGEMCDAFSAPFFNVNCDETFDLGKGKSKAIVDSIGPAAFYAGHVRFLYDVVKKHKKQLMVWGDIALQHEDILDKLPRDIIYLTWEYGNPVSYDPWILPFKKRGLEFMVCPGILNSNRLFPDLTMAAANIQGFVKAGKKNGATGVYTTIWDDGGASFFSGDWYGVYKAAEKSWNIVTPADKNFNTRYTLNAYGTTSQYYVQAMDSLMQLRKLSMTFNLTDNFWYQRLLPDSGRRLLLNNAETTTALRIVQSADRLIKKASAQRNTTDLQTLQFTIDQYRLVIDSRIVLPKVAAGYSEAQTLLVSNPGKTTALLNNSLTVIGGLEKRYLELRNRFRTIWLQENQPYWLDVSSKIFDNKIDDLREVQSNLQRARSAAGAGATSKWLPSPVSIQLDIVATPYFHFQNWLLCGPFSVAAPNQSPDFLYAPGTNDQTPPKPGDIIEYQGKSFRWQKYASPNGGITELADFYKADIGKMAYAFCTITADSTTKMPAFIAANSGTALYCNGQPLFDELGKTGSMQEEKKLMLPLRKGVNYIVLKIPKMTAAWTFTFRLDPAITVTNHKHKFYLNPKTGNHDAE